MQYFSSNSSNSIPVAKPKNPSLPPEITKHYIQQQSSNNFVCKYCMCPFVLNSGRSIQQMIWHTQSFHQKVANNSTKRYTLEEKMDNLKPPPKYLNKYEHMDIISDRWLDRLIIDGYPVSQIMQNVFQRLTANSDLFLLSCERRAKILHHAQPHIIAYLPHLPLHFLPDEAINHLSKKFKINYEGAGLLLKRHNWSFQKGLRMYYRLRELNVGIKVLREGFNDSVVVFANERMKKMYHLYGDSINLEYRFVPLKRSHSGMHYNIGLFLGQDSALRVILFGVALLNGYCIKNIKASIGMFLQIMKFRCPETIITDHTKTIVQSVEQIKSQLKLPFKHMINWHYCTEKMKVELANEPDYRQCLRRLTSALSAITRNQYDFIIRQLKNNGRIGQQKLAQFQTLSEKCCFSGANPRFVGFGVQQDRILGVTKQVQNSFFYMNRIGLFYSLAFRLENKWNSTSEQLLMKTSPYNHPVAEMQYLSKKLSREVFSKLLSLYTHSLNNLQILSKHEKKPFYKIRDKSKSSQIGEYDVYFDLSSHCWRCNCLLIYWSGLPCEHLIKIVRFFKGSLAYYINERWRITSDWGPIPAFQFDRNDNSLGLKQNQNNDKVPKQTIKQINKVKSNSSEKAVDSVTKLINENKIEMRQENKIESNEHLSSIPIKLQM